MAFIEYFGTVDRPSPVVQASLREVLGKLGTWAGDSYREGERLSMKVGPSKMAKSVSVEVGEPMYGSAAMRVPIRWRATGAGRMFPEMTADLVIQPLGEEATILTFQGSYEPPLGEVGRVLDRAVLHRVAQVSVKDFVDRIVAALSEG